MSIHRTRNHQAPISVDLTKLLESLGYIKREKPKAGPGHGQFRTFDSRTSAQLQELRWSGMRSNDMWNRFEIWILGNLHTTLTYSEFFLNPDRLNLWYCETFGLNQITFDTGVQRDIEILKERKATLSEPDVQRAVNALEEKKAKDKK